MLKILINTLIGVVLVLIWAHFVNLGEIIQTISRLSLTGLIPVFVFMLVSPILRATRLKIFLSETKKIPLLDLIFLNGVAMVLNFFIPIRMGEIAKGVYLNTKFDLPLGKSIIWIFLDRFVDFLTVLALAAGLFLIVPTSLSITFVVIITVILTIALITTYLAIFNKKLAQSIVGRVKHILIFNGIKIYFDRFTKFILDSFSILNRHPKDLILLILITILAYGADAAIWYFTFISLGNPQNYLKMYLGQLLSALTYLIPAAPGYVGSAEASGLLILSGIFGINNNLASAMTVLFHIASALFVIVFGLISIFSLKLDLGLIFKKAFRKGD